MKGLNYLLIVTTLIFNFYINASYSQNAEYKADSINTLITIETEHENTEEVKSLFVELANVYEFEGDWEKYDETVQRMLSFANEKDDLEYKAECFNKLGISNCLRGKNELALEYFSKALQINEELQDSISISNSYENLGLVYKDLSDYDKALSHQIKSLKIREKVNHPRLANNYVNISTIYYLTNDTLNYFKYLNQAKIVIQDNKNIDYSLMAIIHNEIADYYEMENLIDSMIFHYQKVVDYSAKIGWKKGMAVGYSNLAEVYYSLKQYDKAIAEHRKVLNLSLEIDDCMSIAEEYEYLAVIYEAIGKLDSALILNQKSLEKTYECGLGKERLNALQTASRIYETKGNYALALEYNKKYQSLHDSLFNIDKQNTIAEIETQYQTEKKQQQIELLSAENQIKNQRIRLGIAAISGLLLLVIVIISIMIIRKRNAQLAQDDLKQKLFRSQMNPHFIYNALGSIQNYMYKNETKKAAQFLGNFASLSRSILKYSAENTIDLTSEIEMLKNYIELEKMRVPNVFDYEIIMDYDLETDLILIAPMMIQPFIENAIKHGFCDKKEDGILKIELIDKKDLLEVIITDNGIGINNSRRQNSKHESMSTKIFYDRMKYLKKKNKHIPDIEIKDISTNETSGTKVLLYLPILN